MERFWKLKKLAAGYLHSEISVERAIYHYQKAVRLTNSNSEKRKLIKEIARNKPLKDISLCNYPVLIMNAITVYSISWG